jgi:hypothetical protein
MAITIASLFRMHLKTRLAKIDRTVPVTGWRSAPFVRTDLQ